MENPGPNETDTNMQENQESAKRILSEFKTVVDQIIGVFLDATVAFPLVPKIVKGLKSPVLVAPKNGKGLTVLSPRRGPLMYGEAKSINNVHRIIHSATKSELKMRTKPGGSDQIFVGNMALVTIYGYWEDKYRQELANALGVKKDELKVDLFGDLNKIRRSIIHNRGVAFKDTGKCEVLRWCSPGDTIRIDRERILELFDKISQLDSNELSKQLKRPNPNWSPSQITGM